MSRSGRAQAKAEKAAAERSAQIWAGKRDATKNATEKATFQRGVDRANRTAAAAQRTINRHDD